MELWDALTTGAEAGRRTLHCWNGDRFESTLWGDVARDGIAMTAGLRAAGVRPGARVASILTNTPLSVRGVLGTWLAGGMLASFPVPARGMLIDEYADQLRQLVATLEPDVMLVDDAVLGFLPDDVRWLANARTWSSVAGTGSVDLSPPERDDVAFVQYSSGSTSTPKGCALSTRAIEAQIALILEMVAARRGEDCDVSWLPLSHDMGLFGNLLPAWTGDLDLVLSTPERFMHTPRTWFDDIATFGAQLTCGTDTALRLATRRHRRRLPRPLALRTIILGAERIHWDTLNDAVHAFGPDGLTPEALMPAYGLAEATLAVTNTPAGEAPRRVVADAVALADGEVAEVEPDHPSATSLVASGRPCPGVELGDLPHDRLGEIHVSSVALADGYLDDEDRTRDRFGGGELRTGDLGFTRDGYLYPVARLDDVISVGGRNVYAREVEAAVGLLPGIRPGCSTLIQYGDGTDQRLILLAELRDGWSDFRALAEEAARVAMAKAAVALDECLFLPKGVLPKTPTGKVQRYRCRHVLSSGRLDRLARVELTRA
jgi:fatty-acyl-CoA synthase